MDTQHINHVPLACSAPRPTTHAIDTALILATESAINAAMDTARAAITDKLPDGYRVNTSVVGVCFGIYPKVEPVQFRWAAEVFRPAGRLAVSVTDATGPEDLIVKTLAAIKKYRTEVLEQANAILGRVSSSELATA